MSKPSCDSCNNLMETAPQFIQNGVTDNICASLKNNTGFSNSTTRTNCDDLHDANDCLIGKYRQKLGMFDTCAWPAFMKEFIPNLYELEKAIICGNCGQWEKLQQLEDRIEYLCGLLNMYLLGDLHLFGDLPGLKIPRKDTRQGGEIMLKDNIPAAAVRTDIGDYDSLGIMYRKETFYDCNGKKKTYEWLQPRFYCYIFGSNVAYDDVIWRADAATIKKWGFTDSLIASLESYPQWWTGFGRARGQRVECTLWLGMVSDYLEMRMIGSLGDMQNAYIDTYKRNPMVHVS